MSKCLFMAAVEPSPALLIIRIPSFLPWLLRLSVCQQNISWGSYRAKGGKFQGICPGNALCIYRAEALGSKTSLLPKPSLLLFITGSNTPPGQVLNDTHNLLCSIFEMSSFSSVLVITALWAGMCNWTHFTKEKVRHIEAQRNKCYSGIQRDRSR